MHQQNYQESVYEKIIDQIQTPSRYSGNEVNVIKKDWQSVDLTFALVFPDLYEIGTSHFGLQILYSLLNQNPSIAAERFFSPAPDMEKKLKEHRIPCLSMESRQPLDQFDIIGISLLYELNFTNILTIFDLSGIPFYAEQRTDTFPLVIGGGPCAFNPEPLADFFDAFVIGDGEEVVLEISSVIMQFKKDGDRQKKTLLKELSGIPGVYVPSFFEPAWDETGLQTITPLMEDYQNVRRAFLPELTCQNFPAAPVVPFGKPVHDRLRLEIARGCSRGCRFCQAGMIYRPVRERPLSSLVEMTRESLGTTGYADISLLSLSTGDYSQLPELMSRLTRLNQGYCTSVSLPSVRAEKLTPELMNIIKQARKTGFTIAPEAGSQRLRDIINKNLTEENIEATVANALELGWKTIKLYFMMGLPMETQEDIAAISLLSSRLAKAYAKGNKAINVSVAGFIPKPHTPFQREAQISIAAAREKLDWLKKNLTHKKVKLKWQDPQMSYIEGVWARGDRKLSRLLEAAYHQGCRLDGWSDYFDFSLWENAFEKTGIDPEFYTTRQRSQDEILPWDHIDSGVSSQFFKKERLKAQKLALTPDCRENDCTGCGICDFDRIQPRINELPDTSGFAKTGAKPDSKGRLPDEAFQRFELIFSKLDEARHLGHLELATIFRRAVRRAGLAVKYSKGFNPTMRLSFENALPVGLESETERLFVYFEKDLSGEKICRQLNRQLPEGILVASCRLYTKKNEKVSGRAVYQICLKEGSVSQAAVDRLLQMPSLVIEDRTKKGKIRRTDLRKAVERIDIKNKAQIEMILTDYNERTIRPMEILIHGLGMTLEDIQAARIRKIKQG